MINNNPTLNPGNDTLFASRDNPNLFGNGGNDVLVGDIFANLLDGGDGDDELFGEGGNDTLLGGAGNDRLIGGDGRDVLNGGLGRDIAWGEGGNDRFIIGDGDSVIGGAGYDFTSSDIAVSKVFAYANAAGGPVLRVEFGPGMIPADVRSEVFVANAGNLVVMEKNLANQSLVNLYDLVDIAPRAAGVAWSTERMNEGIPFYEIAKVFMKTDEAQAKFGHLSNLDTVKAMYVEAFGFQPTQGAVDHLLSVANNYGKGYLLGAIAEFEAQAQLVGQGPGYLAYGTGEVIFVN